MMSIEDREGLTDARKSWRQQSKGTEQIQKKKQKKQKNPNYILRKLSRNLNKNIFLTTY